MNGPRMSLRDLRRHAFRAVPEPFEPCITALQFVDFDDKDELSFKLPVFLETGMRGAELGASTYALRVVEWMRLADPHCVSELMDLACEPKGNTDQQDFARGMQKLLVEILREGAKAMDAKAFAARHMAQNRDLLDQLIDELDELQQH